MRKVSPKRPGTKKGVMQGMAPKHFAMGLVTRVFVALALPASNLRMKRIVKASVG